MSCRTQAKPRPTEDQLQRALCQWLDSTQWEGEYFAVPNGGKRNVVTAAILKATGTKAGVADLVFWGMPDCPLAFIELKRKDGDQNPNQIKFEESCRVRKAPYHVIKSDDPAVIVDTVTGFLRAWGAMR